MLSTPEKLLSALLFGNTVVNVVASVLAVSITADLFPDNTGLSLALSVTLMTLLLLVFGEISPKTLAVSHAGKWASRSSAVMLVYLKLCAPVASTLSRMSKYISHLTGIGHHGETLSHEEIIALVELGQSEGLLGREAGATLNLLTLEESQCTHVMKPRSEVVVLRTGWTRERFTEIMDRTGFTRYPVLDGQMEKVVGYVDSREYLLSDKEVVLPLYTLPSFPENARLETVLRGLRDSDEEAGAVFDEYGDWTGLITTRDIIDSILLSPAIEKGFLPDGVTVKDGWIEIPASMKLITFSELLRKDIHAKWAETCAGLLMEVTGRIPEVGEEIFTSGYLFRIVSKSGPRLERLEVRYDKRRSTQC
jgi:CBS domain containing-hemolysin-like protein